MTVYDGVAALSAPVLNRAPQNTAQAYAAINEVYDPFRFVWKRAVQDAYARLWRYAHDMPLKDMVLSISASTRVPLAMCAAEVSRLHLELTEKAKSAEIVQAHDCRLEARIDGTTYAYRNYEVAGDNSSGVMAKIASDYEGLFEGRGLATRLTLEVMRRHPKVKSWRTTGRRDDGELFWAAMKHRYGAELGNPVALFAPRTGTRWCSLYSICRLLPYEVYSGYAGVIPPNALRVIELTNDFDPGLARMTWLEDAPERLLRPLRVRGLVVEENIHLLAGLASRGIRFVEVRRLPLVGMTTGPPCLSAVDLQRSERQLESLDREPWF